MIAIHPFPFLDFQIEMSQMNLSNRREYVTVTYEMSDFLLAFMFFRLLLLIRTIFNYTMFTDIYAKRLCESYGFTANIRFAFKCFIIMSPGTTVVYTLIVSTLIFAYVVRIFDVKYFRTIG